MDDKHSETGEAYQGLFEPKFHDHKYKQINLPTYEVEGMDSDKYNDRFTSKSTYLNAADQVSDRHYDRAQKHYRNSKRAQSKKLEIRRARQLKRLYEEIDPYWWYDYDIEDDDDWKMFCEYIYDINDDDMVIELNDEQVYIAMKLAA